MTKNPKKPEKCSVKMNQKLKAFLYNLKNNDGFPMTTCAKCGKTLFVSMWSLKNKKENYHEVCL